MSLLWLKVARLPVDIQEAEDEHHAAFRAQARGWQEGNLGHSTMPMETGHNLHVYYFHPQRQSTRNDGWAMEVRRPPNEHGHEELIHPSPVPGEHRRATIHPYTEGESPEESAAHAHEGLRKTMRSPEVMEAIRDDLTRQKQGRPSKDMESRGRR